ncbi:MAG: 5'-3' exonuclease H3TH domain-containing protein [Solirubrobacteraceae bacterium]|nr:5'-3' exonuclease H3TH domain-containing protein [Solirubrobacteraceae bacterium]
MPAGPLLVVDAPSILYRSYFAMPSDIVGSDGKPVGAVLGFIRFVMTEIDACVDPGAGIAGPRGVVICFGAEEASYRVELLPQYHAHRDPMPDDLRPQFEQAAEVCALLGWRVSQHETLEADDLLGAYAKLEHAAKSPCRLITGDRDIFQCVTANVTVRFPQGAAKGVATVTPAGVGDWVGCAPSQVPELIALRGDTSDGIPGAAGIGAKTAAALLAEYLTLERVIAKAEKIASGEEKPLSPLSLKRAQSIAGSADDLRTYLKVAQLQPVPVDRPADHETDWAGGSKAAAERGMNRLAEALDRRA